MISRFSDWKDFRDGRGGTHSTPADGSHYQRWQAELLAYSHRKVHQTRPLVRLLSYYEEASPFPGRPLEKRKGYPFYRRRDE
jgi:hypothetical protein